MASEGFDSSSLQNFAFQIIADKLPGQLVDKLSSALGLVPAPVLEKENLRFENRSGESNSSSAIIFGFNSNEGHSKSTEVTNTAVVSWMT